TSIAVADWNPYENAVWHKRYVRLDKSSGTVALECVVNSVPKNSSISVENQIISNYCIKL
ncbi:hypothetical protein, partial [Nostoc sp.]